MILYLYDTASGKFPAVRLMPAASGGLSTCALSSEADGTGSIDIYSRIAVLSVLSSRR